MSFWTPEETEIDVFVLSVRPLPDSNACCMVKIDGKRRAQKSRHSLTHPDRL